MHEPSLLTKSRSDRVMDQCQEIGRQLRFKFHQSVPDGASLADDCFTRWLRDNESVNIDWSNFGAHHDA